MKKIEGRFANAGGRYTLVAARFNGFIVDHLIEGARDTLVRHGVNDDDITLVQVPGAFELPQAVNSVVKAGQTDAVISLGCVIRGATPHFDYVSGECVKGIGQLAMQADIPVVLGVLTTDSIEQAIERAGTKAGNKGAEAAMAALEMSDLIKQIRA